MSKQTAASAQNGPASGGAVPTGRLILQFTLFLIGAMVLVFAMLWGLEALAGIVIDGSSTGLVVPTVAAMATAMQWYNGEKTRPQSGRVWRFALTCAVVTVALQTALLVLLYLTGLLEQALKGQPVGSQELLVFAVVLGVAAVLQFLMIRLGLGLGLRVAEKQARQLAERNARK